ncbi:MAG: glycerophosphodiester phosphodiesterase [Pyrinomonadaceae bacterium]
MTRPLVIGHRGASAHAPENTLAAFQMAIDAGAEGVEFDVRLAKDHIPVVIHDHDLKRTGLRSERVADLTSDELNKIDIGSWFNLRFPKRSRPEFADQTVPTLGQVLNLLADFGGLIYIELKPRQSDHLRLTEVVCELIKDSPLLPQMIVKSFKLAVIPNIKHLLPEVQTAALFAPAIMHFLRHREHIVTLAKEFGADQISIHHTLVTPKLSKLAAEADLPVTVWTVDDPRWLSRRNSLKIRALITNDPAKFLK